MTNDEERTLSLDFFSDDEIKYICDSINHQEIIGYFTKNAKQFNKIRPGFRPKSIPEKEAKRLLFININNYFISSFIERRVEMRLIEIKEHYNKCINNDDTHLSALLHTLPYSVFSENIMLYFKMIGENFSENEFGIMCAAISTIGKFQKEVETQKEEQKSKESHINNLESQLKVEKSSLVKCKTNLENYRIELQVLKNEVAEMKMFKAIVNDNEKQIMSYENEINALRNKIIVIQEQLSDSEIKNKQLREQIRVEIEEQKNIEAKESHEVMMAKRPCEIDMDEFSENLGYNLIDIGISSDEDYYSLICEHLCNTIFMGMPIIINRAIGINIAKCISNALIGQEKIDILTFNINLSTEKIDNFLFACGRIACLDNFIGNYNETELIPLLEKHKDKIVFVTSTYDRTLNYVAKEFLQHCFYLNLNRIQALSVNKVITEDPSTFPEEDFIPIWSDSGNRYSDLLKTILHELGFSQVIISQKCLLVFDEGSLIRLLAFDILPYCADVLGVSPFNSSARLLKYAGDSGRCPQKNLFKEWFVR